MSLGMGWPWALMLVALGGALGAVLRHLLSLPPLGPVRGVLVVNVLGAGAVGVLVGAVEVLPVWLFLLLGVGLCGALTTWSTLAVQVWQTGRSSPGVAAALLGLTLVLGVGAAWSALHLTRWLWG